MDDKVLSIILRAKDEASETIKNVGKQTSGLADILSGSFKNAAIVSGVALAGLATEAVRSIGAFQDSQKVMAQTEAVLRSTKGAAGVTAEEISNLAGRLQRMTGISDETVQSAENMLLTFTNIGSKVFPDATKTVLDMSVALGQDTKNSAIQLGKALNDPINGVTALRRVGVTFTESQKEQIRAFQESGQLMEAQKLVLKELQTEFGGSAEAAGKTFAGQLSILKESVGNLEEKFGELLANAIGPLIPKFQAVVDVVTQITEGGADLGDLTDTLSELFGTFGLTVGRVIEFLAAHKEVLIAVGGALAGIFSIAVIAATVAMLGFIGLSLPVMAFFALIGAGVALAIVYWDKLVATAKSITKAIGDFFSNLGQTISGVIGGIIGDIRNMVNSVIDHINKLIRGVNTVGGKLGLGSIKIPEIPKFEQGGYVPRTGLAQLHEGEFVLSKDMLAGRQASPVSNFNQPINIYATVNNDMDLDALGYRISWHLRNAR